MDRKIVISALFASLFMVSCFDSFDSVASYEKSEVTANTSIKEIHAAYTEGTREINEELIISGTITANDEHNNIFKSFIIENDGYAIEVLDGLFDSYVRHPLGGKVAIKLKGLGLARQRGVLRTGLIAPASSSYELDYMTSEVIVDNHITLQKLDEEPNPKPCTIKELQKEEAGRFIEIQGIQLHTADGAERKWREYALFRNSDLDTIWCYTSPYADFANSIIPQGELTLRGILEYGNTDTLTNQFIIKLRGEKDSIF